MWLELELDVNDTQVRVSGRGSRGERPATHTLPPALGTEAPPQALAGKVGRAVRARARRASTPPSGRAGRRRSTRRSSRARCAT